MLWGEGTSQMGALPALWRGRAGEEHTWCLRSRGLMLELRVPVESGDTPALGRMAPSL